MQLQSVPLQSVPTPRTPGEEQAEESQVPALDREAGRQHLAAPCTPPSAQAALDRQASRQHFAAIMAQDEAELAAWNAAQLAGVPAQREHLRQCLVAEPETEADWVARLHAEQSWLITDRPEDLAAQAE